MSANLFVKSIRYMQPSEIEDWSEWRLSKLAPAGISLVNSTDKSDAKRLQVPQVSVTNEPIYFRAPKPYLGNKVTSYGLKIKYSLLIQAPISGLDKAKEVHRADLIIRSKLSNMVLIHISVNRPVISEVFNYEITLNERHFSHQATGSKVSREQLMTVLASISDIEIRATYFDEVHETELLDFTVEMGVEESVHDANLDRPVVSAERCACPPTYRGYSCESCEYGYYKTLSRGPGKFNCERCKCNGHADTCDQDTGKCFECRGNTEGDDCGQCKKGYHKMERADGSFECVLCPCPGNSEQTVFADSCMIDAASNNAYYCNCQPGYYGNYCQRCAPGYFGNPREGMLSCFRTLFD